MKVPSQISSNPVVRGLVAVALAWVLAAGGAAPAAAIAEGAPAPAAPIVSADTSATAPAVSAEATATTPSPSATATPVAAAAPVKKKVSAKKLSVRAQIAAIGKSRGLSGAEVSALLWIAKHESNFHPTSKSSSGCYGLFQLSSSIVRGHPWQNPTWNTKRAIKYMKGRYHGVLKAKGFWLSHHWY